MKTITITLKILNKVFSVGILAVVFFIIGAHFVGADYSNLPTLTAVEKMSVAALSTLLLGTLVGLRWELWGGLITILGYLGFVLIEGGIVLDEWFLYFLLSGIINVVLYFLLKRTK